MIPKQNKGALGVLQWNAFFVVLSASLVLIIQVWRRKCNWIQISHCKVRNYFSFYFIKYSPCWNI